MSVVAAIAQEMNEAYELQRAVRQIRVTPNAVPGSVVCVPMTSPEGGRLHEILVHPVDWRDALLERSPDQRFLLDGVAHPSVSDPRRVWGVQVVHEVKDP